MSKITQEKKEAKLKGKQLKIAKSTAKKTSEESNDETKASSKCLNYGKCCTCIHYPKHKNGHEAQPCKVSKIYVARKAEHSECYKCKF